MQLGMIGLGKMGGNMVERVLRDSDHEVVVYDRDHEAVARAETLGATGVYDLEQFVESLEAGSRVVWLMLPAGDATQHVLDELAPLLKPGDLVIDGGNSHWRDDIERAGTLRFLGIHYVDVGTSGGIHGLEHGYCMMVGGGEPAVEIVRPILDVLAPPRTEQGSGWLHVGEPGAGHYVKMIHNGIEYGMMQAFAEGFALLAASDYSFDHAAIARLWQRGSVIRSWLLELTALSFQMEGNNLGNLAPVVPDSGEGRWTVDEGVRLRVPVPVIAASLFARFTSQDGGDFAAKLQAALREQFGGHAVERAQA